jgi:hypothetical protein
MVAIWEEETLGFSSVTARCFCKEVVAIVFEFEMERKTETKKHEVIVTESR